MKTSLMPSRNSVIFALSLFCGIGQSTSAQAVTNLLTNPNFASAGTGWTATMTAPATGAIKFTTGTGLFAIDVKGTANYQAQLYQLVNVTAGKSYDYSFTAKKASTGTRNIDFVVEGNVSPYSKDLLRTIAIDGTAKTYSGTFTATATRAVRIEIQGGLSDLDFEVDNFVVSVKSTADTTAPVISGLTATPQYDDYTSTRALNFSATDNVGVTGYLVTVSDDSYVGNQNLPVTPSLNDPNWTTIKPTEASITFDGGIGIAKVMVYVKDAAGNIGSATTSFTLGDYWENDDTPADAKEVLINDGPQYRNSHAGSDTGGNPDWAKFTVVQGQQYTVMVNHDIPFYGPASTLSLFTSSNLVNPVTTLEEPISMYPDANAESTSITFTAAYSGTYYALYIGRPVLRSWVQKENYRLTVSTPTYPDTVPPQVSNFYMYEEYVYSTETTRGIFINASDNNGPVEYALLTWDGCFWCNTPPPAPVDGDPQWTSIKPTTITVPKVIGDVNAVVYVKDQAGNINNVYATLRFTFVDEYENDDSADSAREVVVNAAPQNRTNAGKSPYDWAFINTEVGKTYTVSVTESTLATYIGAKLRVYPFFVDEATAVPLAEVDEGVDIVFTATSTGPYYIRYQGRSGYKHYDNEPYTLAVTAPVTPTNLLLNGNFATAGTSWTSKITAPATGSFTYTTGTAKFNINTASTNNADFQLSQKINIVSGKKYNYSFTAKKLNAGTRNISFLVVSALTPFTRDVDRQIAIDGNGATFTGTFTATSSRAVNISFRGGLSDLDFEVDDVVITAAP